MRDACQALRGARDLSSDNGSLGVPDAGGRSGMTRQPATLGALRAKGIRQLKEVYDRALAVQSKYAESHAANRAAKRLIEAFEAASQADGTATELKWLSETTPKGNA